MKVLLVTIFVFLSLFLTETVAVRKVTKKQNYPSGIYNSEVASISWGTNSRRVYVIEDGVVVEHANDGNGWYIGTFPKPSAVSVAAVYIGTAGLRVYVTGDTGTTTEYCGSTANTAWSAGSYSGSGTVVSANIDEQYTVAGGIYTFYLYILVNGDIQEVNWNSGFQTPVTVPVATSDT